MSTTLHTQRPVPSLWERLAWALELFGDSQADRSDGRVERLEAEVERLSALRREPVST